MKKKLLAILLALTAAGSLVFGLAACDNNGDNGDNTGANTEQNTDNTGANTEQNGGNNEDNTEQNGDNTGDNYGDSGEQSTPIVDSEGLEFSLSEDETCYAVTGIGICKDTKLYIPKTYNDKPVTSIGDRAFWECISLESITIPDSVTSIDGFAFVSCISLTSISIPDSVISIGGAAFAYCISLTSIAIPASVTSIGEDAFMGCSSLESITVEEGNTVYHSAGNCLIETGSKTLIAGFKNSVIPIDGSVTSIRDSAFYNCSSLESITIPNSVTNIGNSAFRGCSSLESITVESGNTVYHSAGNCIIETESKTLIAGCKNSIIPTDGSVTSIGDSAFHYCSSLTSITIPGSVTSIGDHAFRDCNSLESITYKGTKAQWNAITKGSLWNSFTGDYVIHCTDGDIAKS